MVSIIIPVYNTGKILDKCLKSVHCQTYKDWECIIVNDCSTDKKTNELLKKWIGKSSNFVFVEKNVNEGVDKARFSGLSAARGEYITFVDSDDWLEVDALEVLVAKAEEVGADVVVGRMRKVYWGGLYWGKSASRPEWMERLIEHAELMDKYYLSFFGVNILPVNLCATLYRRRLFDEARLSPSGLKFGEDLVVNMRLFPFIKSYYAVDKIIYNYRVELPGSSDKYLDSWLDNARKLYELKMNVLSEVGFGVAVYYQQVELVNYLKTYVNACVKYRKNRKKENVVHLKRALDVAVCETLRPLQKGRYKDKELLERIVNGDAFGMYNLMELRYKTLPFRTKAFEKCMLLIKKIVALL